MESITARIALTDELIAIRRHLHAHPERSFHETETSAYLERVLRDRGIDVLANPMETGVVAQITGAHAGPTVALRADIDGLPIHEDSGLDFASVTPGVMHGCGHDLHMASLLGAVFWLSAHRELIGGTVRIIFQPAEELGLGARAVIDAGLIDGVKAIIDLHAGPKCKATKHASNVLPADYDTADLRKAWRVIATRFKDHPATYAYDILNEPSVAPETWKRVCLEGMADVRRIDAKTPFMMESGRAK